MSAESLASDRIKSPNDFVFVSSKYTNAPLLPSLVVALVGGSVSLALAYLVKGFLPGVYGLIMERGPIQFLTVYSFWFALGMMAFKWRQLQKERSAFKLDFIRGFTAGSEVVGTKTMLAGHDAIEENLDPSQKDLILVNRINKGIKQLRINSNPGDVAGVLKTVAETDSAVVDSSYILIKYMIWAIPVLGFIGTIIGMTQAIGSFDVVLKGISEIGFSGVKDSLGLVTGGLALAFETTFLALVLSAVLNLLSNALQKGEEDLLSDVEEFTTDNIVNKYSSLRNQVQAMPQIPDIPAVPELPEFEDMVRQLKNMNRQNQANADHMLEQLGRVIEAVQAGPSPAPTKAEGAPEINLEKVLLETRQILEAQADFIKHMDAMAEMVRKNAEVLDRLPQAIDAMSETSRKLGKLFANIYNRSFGGE